MKNIYSKLINYLLVIILVFVSGVPYISQYDNTIITLLLPVTMALFLIRKIVFDFSFIYFLGVFMVLTSIQLITFHVFPVLTTIGIFSKIIIAYIIVKIVNKSFIIIYINIIYIITIVSFVFWIPAFLSESVRNMISANAPFLAQNHTSSFIIFLPNWGDTNLVRNSGPFWEPGSFAGFLMIALIPNYIKYPILTERKNLILLIGIISTFSTTGYLALFLFVILIKIKYRSIFHAIVLFIFIIPTSIIAYQHLPFLKNKIDEQLKTSKSKISYNNHRTRFTSAIIDLKDFQKYPIAGRGKFEETRFDKQVKAINRNNGTTDFLVMYGIVGFIMYFSYYFMSFRKILHYNNLYKKNIPYFIILIIFVLGFSENYFMLPFFWGICFIHYTIDIKHQPKFKLIQKKNIPVIYLKIL